MLKCQFELSGFEIDDTTIKVGKICPSVCCSAKHTKCTIEISLSDKLVSSLQFGDGDMGFKNIPAMRFRFYLVNTDPRAVAVLSRNQSYQEEAKQDRV